MDGYETEKEQIEAIKKWWSENGTWIVVGLALGLSGLFGYRYWQDYTREQAESASTNYENFLAFIETNQAELALSTGAGIMAEFPKSPYSSLAALHMARIEVFGGNYEKGEEHLDWVITNGEPADVKRIAEIRKLRLLLDSGRAAEATGELDTLLASDSPALLELAADIQAANQNLDDAIGTYDRILALDDLAAEYQALIELKIDAIGR